MARLDFVRRFLKRDIYAGSVLIGEPFPHFMAMRHRHTLILSCKQKIPRELFLPFARKIVRTKVGFVCTVGPVGDLMHDWVDRRLGEITQASSLLT